MTITLPTHDILPALIRWAEERGPIRAVLLTSTRAVPGAPVDAHLGYVYPEQLHQRVKAYVETIRRLEPPGTASASPPSPRRPETAAKEKAECGPSISS